MNDIIFEIKDSSKRKAKPCAKLVYSDEDGFTISIDKSSTVFDVPAFFIPFLERNEYEIPNEWAKKWIQERIVPSGRQNLGEVLLAHGLNEYSEIELLRANNGESSDDSFIIKELVDSDLSIKTRQNKKVFGQYIKSRRIALGYSQASLANVLGIDQPSLSRIEAGKSNPTYDLLLDIDSAISQNGIGISRIPESPLWNKERIELFNLIQSVSHDMAMTYERLVNELEMYSEENATATVDSAVIAHCLRELINSFPDYEFEGKLPKGKQNDERNALNELRDNLHLLDGFESNPSTKMRSIPSEIFESLLHYKVEWEKGEQNREARDAAAMFGDNDLTGLTLPLWKTARDLAMSNAHLKRHDNGSVPSRNEYIDNLVNVESIIGSRLRYVFDTKKQINSILIRANSVNEKGEHSRPTGSEVNKTMALLTRPIIRSSFFRNLKNPFWLPVLNEVGALEAFIESAKKGEEASVYEFEEYIVYCAEYEPKEVFELLNRIASSDNYQIRRLLLKASVHFPLEYMEKMSKTFEHWAKDGYGIGQYFWDTELLSLLLNKLLLSKDDRYSQEGLRLFTQLVRLRSKTDLYINDLCACISNYDYSSFVHSILHALPQRRVFQICKNNINKYIQINNKVIDNEIFGSRWLISSLQEKELVYHETSRDYIFTWIDVLKHLLIDSLDSNESLTITAFEKSTSLIKRTIIQSLHEYLNSSSEISDVAAELFNLILQSDSFIEDEYEVEIVEIMEDFLIVFSPDELERFLDQLSDRLECKQERLYEHLENRKGQKMSPEQFVKRKVELFEFAILSSIGEAQLPMSYQKKLRDYKHKYGSYAPSQHPFSTRTLTGPNSPIDVEEMKNMDAKELLAYMKHWRPTEQDQFELVEQEGLSRKIGELIVEDPCYFDGLSEEIKGLELVYITGIVDGWRKAVENSADITMEDCSKICLWLSSYREEGNPGLLRAQLSVAWFIEEVLDSSKNDISDPIMINILKIIYNLSRIEDKRPILKQNGESIDLLTASINDIRSLSVGNAGRWLLKTKDNDSIDKTIAFEVLESALPDRTENRSDVVALALQIPNIVHSDKYWVDMNYVALFGSTQQTEQQRLILSSILSTFNPNPSLLKYIKNTVLKALDNDAASYPNCSEIFEGRNCLWEIGSWIYQSYIVGAISEEDELFQKWISVSDSKTKGSVLNHICHLVVSSSEIDEALIIRIRDLWNLHSAIANYDPDALEGSLSLLESHRFPTQWMKNAILEESKNRDFSKSFSLYSRDLLDLAVNDSDWGVNVLANVLKRDSKINIHRYKRYAEEALRFFIKNGGSEDDSTFRYCMEKLGSAGWLELDELVLAG